MLIISCVTWSTLYFALCLVNPKRSYEWHIRSVTLVHSLTVTVLGAYCAFIQGPWPFTHAGGPSSPFQNFVITISLAYFLLDLSWCLYFRTEGPLMLLHHTLSITGLAVCFGLHWYGTEMVATIFGAEITNPLLQFRWFLREMNKYNTLLGDIVDVAFMFIFGFFRIFLGTILLIYYYSQETDMLGRLGGTTIYTISWLFWISIVRYGYKKYHRKYGKYRIKPYQSSQENGTVSSGASIWKCMHKNGTTADSNMNDVMKRNSKNGTIGSTDLYCGNGHI